MTAVIECFLINAHHTWLFALKHSAEMKHWQKFSVESYVSIIHNILIGYHNLLNLAAGIDF